MSPETSPVLSSIDPSCSSLDQLLNEPSRKVRAELILALHFFLFLSPPYAYSVKDFHTGMTETLHRRCRCRP